MKNFKLKNDEELIKIISNIEVEANENKYVLTVFLTSKRLVLLKDVNKELEYNAFLASRLVNIPENLEVIFDLNIKEINTIKYTKVQEQIFAKNTNKKHTLKYTLHILRCLTCNSNNFISFNNFIF